MKFWHKIVRQLQTFRSYKRIYCALDAVIMGIIIAQGGRYVSVTEIHHTLDLN